MRPYSAGLGTVVFLAAFAGASPAYAYLDPGTGSMVLQGILAAVVGAMVAVRLYWSRLKSLFSGTQSGEGTDEQTGDGPHRELDKN